MTDNPNDQDKKHRPPPKPGEKAETLDDLRGDDLKRQEKKTPTDTPRGDDRGSGKDREEKK